jgi:hypothetical protein
MINQAPMGKTMPYNLDYVEQVVELKELKKGEFFQRIRKGKPSNKVYTKDTWEISEKKFWCNDEDDMENKDKQTKLKLP